VLTLAQLYAVAFTTGTLSILFVVCDPAVFVALVPEEKYVAGQSLVYGSRALSFVGGPSVGGVLVQWLTAPFAVVADALSFLGSAWFLSRIRAAEPPKSGPEHGGLLAGARFIRGSAIVRASLAAVATINFFNFMFFALAVLYAVRYLHIRPGELGVLLGAGAVGGVLGAATTQRISRRLGVGWAYVLGCVVFTAPMVLIPLATGPRPVILIMVFTAEFLSGALAGGALGAAIGVRTTLWIAALGGITGALFLLPSPLPRFRMPAGRGTAVPPQPARPGPDGTGQDRTGQHGTGQDGTGSPRYVPNDQRLPSGSSTAKSREP
jgi:hypothetical protein